MAEQWRALPWRSRLACWLGLPWRDPVVTRTTRITTPDPVGEAFAWLTGQLLQLAGEYQAAADQLNAAARAEADPALAQAMADRAGDFAERATDVRFLTARALTGQFLVGGRRRSVTP